MMNSKDRQDLKARIKSNCEKLKNQIEELKELVKPIAPENAIGRVSRMDAINNKSINVEALRKAKIRYTALKSALDRINDVDFGICMRCGKEIPLGRLSIQPQSKSCVKCAH